jgi:CheY-like chemotaxis protein
MDTNDVARPRQAILVLEDVDFVREAWVNSLQSMMPDVYVCDARSKDEALDVLRGLEKDRPVLILTLVDQVLEGDRQGGIAFLRQIKERYPDVRRVMVSGQSTRDEIQTFLDEGLIHHFQSKSSFIEDQNLPEIFLREIADMVKDGKPGNVHNPDLDKAFNAILRKFIDDLPEGPRTKIQHLSGETIEAGEILNDPQLVEQLRIGFLTSRLDALLPEKGTQH